MSIKDNSARGRRFHLVFILFSLALLFSFSLKAQDLGTQCVTKKACIEQQQPLWEVGVAGIGVYAPDYPASDESSSNQLVVPFFIYRGETLRAGEGGILRALAFEDERFELDLSLDGTFRADSDDNDARQGMEDLDFLIGIGPQLAVNLYENEDRQNNLSVRFQLRSVFSTDISYIDQQGYVFETQFRFEQNKFLHDDLRLVGSVGPIWATEKLMDYFYQVKPEDVIDGRPAYDADGGYLGTELNLGMVVSFFNQRGRAFLGVRANINHGATNDDSPLYKDDMTFSVGLGFAYRFYQSDELAR